VRRRCREFLQGRTTVERIRGETPNMIMPGFNALDRQRVRLIADSHQRLTGRKLVDIAGSDVVAALWQAPLVIVAHDTAPDPVFFFGNARALQLFEMSFADFSRLPSRLSAEPVLQAERARLLDAVTRDGFMDDYAGIRISATGKRFRIKQAVVWNLIAEDGGKHGQAAAFSHWEPVA
jgi:hypothetical protein